MNLIILYSHNLSKIILKIRDKYDKELKKAKDEANKKNG